MRWQMAWLLALGLCQTALAEPPARRARFDAANPDAAVAWQQQARATLWRLLAPDPAAKPVALGHRLVERFDQPARGVAIEQVELQTRAERRIPVWLSVPQRSKGRVGAVLALHGHGGSGEEVVRGKGLYWYGRALAEMGYVVISPDIGSHELQPGGGSLMGQRVWDCLCALDYLAHRPEVDPERIGVAGLSLGGETTMYVAALAPQLKVACSSGWLTTVENMKHGHCPCWNFPGLEEHFDFADVFACVAPRPLVCEVGRQERAPGGFPVPIAQQAWTEVEQAYRVLSAAEQAQLDIHDGGHVFHGPRFWSLLPASLGRPWPWSPPEAAAGAEALRRGEIARRALAAAKGVLDGWWAKRDPRSGLLPRRLDQPVWAPQDNAADLYPFLTLTAYYLGDERLAELDAVLEIEKRLTNRQGALPDWYSLSERRFVHEKADLPRLIFNAAEYCKDGLLPLTEVRGAGPWTERMRELIAAIFASAPIATRFGNLPADDSEVNGDLLQVLARLYWLSRDRKYLAWAERIGDAYCLEVLPSTGGLPPHRWDFARHAASDDTLNLNDHGNELIGGLAELFIAVQAADPDKAQAYREPLGRMFRRLTERARNRDGFWHSRVRATTAEVLDPRVPDTWGYALGATAAFSEATQDASLRQVAVAALSHLDRPEYLNWNGADSYADSLEGGLLLLNRFAVPEGIAWLERTLPIFFGKQRDDGVVEAWYGDGNYARTALMVAQYYSQGATVRPWRQDVRCGAVREGECLHVAVRADAPWSGKLSFDRPRHRLHMGLAGNYPRLNEFPEWFVVEPEARYAVQIGSGPSESYSGARLAEGLALTVDASGPQSVVVRPAPLTAK